MNTPALLAVALLVSAIAKPNDVRHEPPPLRWARPTRPPEPGQKVKTTPQTRFFVGGLEVNEETFFATAGTITGIDVAADGVSLRRVEARKKR